MSHPVKRRVRDVVVPVLGRSAAIQRRAARRISQVYISYPPGGQRMPDIAVRADGQPTTLHTVLRGGRHVLVVPAASLAAVLDEAGLAPYRDDLDVVRDRRHRAGRAGPPGRPRSGAGPARPRARGDRLPERAVRRTGLSPGPRPGPDVHALALRPEQDQQLGGLRPGAPNQCGTRVSNSAASPGFMTKSCSASRSRSWPESTYIHS